MKRQDESVGAVANGACRELVRGVSLVLGAALGLGFASPREAQAQPQESGAVVEDPARGPLDPERTAVNAPAPVSTVAPELRLPEGPEVARARSFMAVRRYEEAAQLLEAQASRSSGVDLRFLYYAGLARAKAGQHGRAAEHLRLVVAGLGLPAELRAELESLVRDACGRAVRVQIQITENTGVGVVTPPGLAAGSVSLESTSGVDGEAPYRLQGTPTELSEVCLDPGPYSVDVAVPGFYPLRVRRVAEGQGEVRSWEFRVEPQKMLVDLRVFPEKALRRGRGTLTLSRTDRGGEGPLVFQEIEPTTTVALTTGTWRAEVEARGYAGQRNFNLSPGGMSIDITLNKRKIDHPKFRRRRKAVGPIAGHFALTYSLGVGLIIGGAFRQNSEEREYEELLTSLGVDPDADAPLDPATLASAEAAIPTADYHKVLRRTTRMQTAGVTMAMHGLGFMVSTLPMLAGGKKRASYIILGAGGAVLAGGAGWMSYYAAREREILGSDRPEDRAGVDEPSELVGHRLGAGMFTGIGSGMVLGSALILAIDRVSERRKVAAAPMMGPGCGGVSLRGEF